MKFTEKTVLVVYIQATIAVLIAALVFRQGIAEAFQAAATTTVTTDIPVKCVGDGGTQCRYIDPASTAVSYSVREQTGTIPGYDCPQTSDNPPKTRSFNLPTLTCNAPADSTDPLKNATIEMDKIKCGFGETYVDKFKKCTKMVGTIPKCIAENSTADSDDVKKNMPCYAQKYPEQVKDKIGTSDIKLLYDDYMNIGRYLVRNPCCDADTPSACPSGYFCAFGQTIEKDWKFWTGVGVLSLVLFLIVLSVMSPRR
jgi:hypothetical protein